MKIIPPWECGEVACIPRSDYVAGVWSYAYGKRAESHPDYERAILMAETGQHPFNPWWIRNWADVEAVLDGCFFSLDDGISVLEFCEYIHHSEGEWSGEVFVPADWQVYDIFLPLFGWMQRNPEHNPKLPRSLEFIRRFKKAYIEVPKKNGKTFMCSMLTIFLLDFDGEQGAKVFSGAVDRDQSSMIYDAAAAMVRQSPELNNHLNCIDSRKRITCRETNSFYMALSSEVSAKEGKNIHGMIFDEIHVYKDRKMWSTMKYGGAIRQQPIQIAITTAGIYDPTSLGWEQHELGILIRDANGDAHKLWSNFAYICGLSDEEADNWTDPEMWKKANPSWGISIRPSEFEDSCKNAQVETSSQNDFLRYRLDVWTAQLNAWMNQSEWDACAADYSEDDLRGLTCYGGIDCSLSEDITALVLWFPPQGQLLKHRFLAWFWVPEERVAKCDSEYNGLYSVWIREGRLYTTPGPTIRQESIREKLNELAGIFSIRTVGYDRAFAQRLADDLESDGFDVGAFGQGFPAMNEPTTEFMKLVLQRQMEHPNHPIMNWHVGNAQAVKDGGDRIRIVKNWGAGAQKAKVRFKVDGLIAAIMALGTSRLDQYPLDTKDEVVWI